MAQTIKIKRGGIGKIATTLASTLAPVKGELFLGTGSFNNLAGPLLLAATADNTLSPAYARVDSLTGNQGPTLAAAITNGDANFTGLFIHSGSKFYRHNGTNGFEVLNVSAGSFDGTLGVTNGGTGLSTIADNSILVSTAANTLSAVALSTNGGILVGGTTIGPAVVAPNALAGAGLTATAGDGTLVLQVNTGSTHITEGVADIVGAMLSGNTETNITVTYQDSDNTIDFEVPDASVSAKGVVELATAAEAAAATSATLAVTPAGLDAFADGRGLLSGSGADNRVAYFNGANALQGSANLTFDDDNLTIASTGQVRFRDTGLYIYSSADGQLDAIADTKLNLQAPTVDIGIIGASTGTTVNIGNQNNTATVNIKGNLNVAGTTTTINSTTVNIDDNIIVLNYGGSETDSGLRVQDSVGGTLTSGSLLWDGTNDYWKAGALGSEKRIIREGGSAGTANYLAKFDAIGTIVNSSIQDNGTTITLAGTIDTNLTAARFVTTTTNGVLQAVTDLVDIVGTIDGGTF